MKKQFFVFFRRSLILATVLLSMIVPVSAALAASSHEEVFYHPQIGQGQTALGHFNHIVSVGGFFTADDNFRHAIVANNS